MPQCQAGPFDHAKGFISKVEALEANATKAFTAIGDLKIRIVDMNPPVVPALKPWLDTFYDELIGRPYPLKFEFTSGAMFAASREAILQHPRSYYQRILYHLSGEVRPIEGHVLERLWRLILDADYRAELRRERCQHSPLLHYCRRVSGWGGGGVREREHIP